MNADTLDALRLRDSVLAIVAHDIRNPLGTIIMTAAMLEDGNLGADQRTHLVDMIRRATAHIDKLIRDLLDIARIEAGQLYLDKSPTPLRPLLAEAIDAYKAQAAGRGISMRLDMPTVDRTILVDRDRILELLGNLITNAIKFTGPGGAITLLCLPQTDHITIAVADTGNGIPEDQLEHIFERFWQANHARRAGAGLGLAICKGIVEAHEGTIRAESEVGVGTTFYVRLPVHDSLENSQ